MTARAQWTVALTVYDPDLAAERTLYFADEGGMATRPDETPAHTVFADRLQQPVDLRRALFSEGRTSGASVTAYGDIVLRNLDGALDWLERVAVDGRSVVVRSGPHGGAYPAEFPVRFSGTMEQLIFERAAVRVRLRDNQAKLNVPLLTARYGGTNVGADGLDGTEADLKGKLKPWCVGVVRQMEPYPVNTAKLIYQVSDNACEVLDVFDRGLALSVTEPDGSSATVTPPGDLGPLTGGARTMGMAYSPLLGLYVAGGRGGTTVTNPGLYTSPDFGTWTGRSSIFDFASFVSPEGVRQVRWLDEAGYFAAVGLKGGNVGGVATSALGTTWADKSPGGAFAVAGTSARCVTYGKGTLVVGGNGGALSYSTDDGASWTACTATGLTQNVEDLWFADGLFVLAAAGGVIYTSNDGITWTARTSGTASNLTAVRFISGRWVITGNSGVVLTSVDGVTWLARTDGTGVGKDDVADDGYSLVSIGGASSPAMSSDRGATWRTLTVPAITARACVFDGQRVRLLGLNGELVTISTAIPYADATELEDDSLAPPPGSYGVLSSSTGTYIRLGLAPAGQLTADVRQGASDADRTAGQLFAATLTKAGYTSADWVAADITALDAAVAAQLGLFLGDERTVAEVLDAIAVSVGAWWGVDWQGKFRIARFEAPGGTAALAVTQEDMHDDSFRVSPTEDSGRGLPSHRAVVRYARNYVVQEDTFVTVPAARRAALAAAWREAVAEDAAVKTVHPLAVELVEETLLAYAADAEDEADRLQALRGVVRRRAAFTLKLGPTEAPVEQGVVVQVTHPRYGFSAGKLMRVVSVHVNAATRTQSLQVWG